MRTIERATGFKRDYKRELKGEHRATIEVILTSVVLSLSCDKHLEPNLRDHDLTGNWKGYRECHIKPDLLLIYRKLNSNVLWLARLGSHSQLFG